MCFDEAIMVIKIRLSICDKYLMIKSTYIDKAYKSDKVFYRPITEWTQFYNIPEFTDHMRQLEKQNYLMHPLFDIKKKKHLLYNKDFSNNGYVKVRLFTVILQTTTSYCLTGI